MPGAGVREVDFEFGDVLRTATSQITDARVIFLGYADDMENIDTIILRPSKFYGWSGIQRGTHLRFYNNFWRVDETWPS